MTGQALPPSIALQQLQLENARALLGCCIETSLPDAKTDPAAYLQALIDGLCELSLMDPLTGCANRRQFETVLDRELDRVARSGDVGLLLMVDIDHFKHINDTYGHVAGDIVLQHVARALGECVRPMDTLARYGGEEFAIVLPACQPAYGQSVAERLRQAVQELRVPISPVQQVQVTISIGGAYALQWIRSTRPLWVERADQQLYRAKSAGRNRVDIEQPPDSTVTAEEKNLLFVPELTTPPAWSGNWFDFLNDPAEPTDGVN